MENLKHMVKIEVDGDNILIGDFLENEHFEMSIKDIEELEKYEDINNIEDFEELEEMEQKEIIIKELKNNYNYLIEKFYQKYIDMNIVNIEEIENFVSPKIVKIHNGVQCGINNNYNNYTHILCEDWEDINGIICTYISYQVQNDILEDLLTQDEYNQLDEDIKQSYEYFDISEYIDTNEYENIYYMDLSYMQVKEL